MGTHIRTPPFSQPIDASHPSYLEQLIRSRAQTHSSTSTRKPLARRDGDSAEGQRAFLRQVGRFVRARPGLLLATSATAGFVLGALLEGRRKLVVAAAAMSAIVAYAVAHTPTPRDEATGLKARPISDETNF